MGELLRLIERAKTSAETHMAIGVEVFDWLEKNDPDLAAKIDEVLGKRADGQWVIVPRTEFGQRSALECLAAGDRELVWTFLVRVDHGVYF